MGYLQDFGTSLEAKLADLPDEQRDAIVEFVKQQVLTSYKNGLRDARTRKDAPRKEKRA